jgi:hypothetical protein
MLVRNNNKNKFNEINWDADYDGETAHISLETNSNGLSKLYNIELDNEDLANLLSVPSVNIPIDKRLKMDLETPKRDLYKIEFPTSTIQEPNTVEDILETLKPNGFLSSPLPNEVLIVPVSINDKTSHNFTLTPRKRHKHKKTHKTYKVYKKRKSSSNKTKSNQKIKYQRL